MATSFHKSDITGCFELDREKAPEFRIVELAAEGKDASRDVIEAGVGVSLMCREHAVSQLQDYADELAGEILSDVPILGLLVLPIRMTPEQVRDLREEITEEVWTE